MKIKEVKLVDIRNRCNQHCSKCPYYILAKTKLKVCLLDILMYPHLYDDEQELEIK